MSAMARPAARNGRLPNFLVVGAPRAGSTTLANYLAEHPEVFMAPEKEVRFFDLQFDRGVDWYRSRFAAATDELAVGEATPSYMTSETTLDRIAATVPRANLIVILRNPIDRAYSQYWWFSDAERRSFEEAVHDEIVGERGPGRRRRYLEWSRYLRQLKWISERFPREALSVSIMEEMELDPPGVARNVYRFLGVDETFSPSALGAVLNPASRVRWPALRLAMLRWRAWQRLPHRLVAAVERLNRAPIRYPPMDPALRARLAEWFAEDNAALARWLGRDLSVWDS